MIPKRIHLYFDGSIKGKNPGGIATYGWRILDEDNQEVAKGNGEALRGPNASNNVAEWAGCLSGLKYLKSNNWSGNLKIFGDSQLVIYQLDGTYRCRRETLIPYYKEAQAILSEWTWESIWIPREKNEFCDQYSRNICS